MPKVSRISSKYKFTEEGAKKSLNEYGLNHIVRLSAVDLIQTMPIEDLKKIFHIQQKDPVPLGNGINEYEIVVSIAIKD